MITAFRQANPPTYDDTPPLEKLETWLHQIESICQVSNYRSFSWVSLAVIQLVDNAASWWRSLYHQLQKMSWQEFYDLITTKFAQSEITPTTDDEFTTRMLQLSQKIKFWEEVVEETMNEYVKRFEKVILHKSPYKLDDEEKCPIF